MNCILILLLPDSLHSQETRHLGRTDEPVLYCTDISKKEERGKETPAPASS